jgi:membrane protein
MIWRTRENRGALSSFLLYWAVLSLSPVFIGLALGISTYLTSLSVRFEEYDPVGMGAYLLKYSPLLLSWAAFSLIYAAVPNCRVPFKHALMGGFIAAAAFNIARSLFTLLVVNSSFTFIYGAFAAVPLFLLWIYLSWNIVLIGGILVHSMSAYQSKEQAARPTVLKALDVLYLMWLRQKSGKDVREIELLNGEHQAVHGLDSDTWRDLRTRLMAARIITQNERGRYLLCRDMDDISFWQLKELINEELSLEKEKIESHLSWQDDAYRMLRDQRMQQRDQLGVSLAELFNR